MNMAKRVGIVLLLVGAASASTLYYLRRGSSAAQTPSPPQLISLIPAGASYVFYADLVPLRESVLLARIAALAPQVNADREYADFVRATGFDYSRDLDRAVLAAQPEPPGNFTMVVAEGRFNREKIIAYALRSGRVERQNGAAVYVVPTQGYPSGASKPRAKEISFTFLSSNRLALAEGLGLAPLLGPHAPAGPDPEMRERITLVAGAAVFAVGRVGSLPENFSLGALRSDQFTNLVRSLRWFSLAARPESDRLKVALEAECDNAGNARQIAGTLEGLRLLGQAALADPRTRQQMPPETSAALETLLRAVEVSRDDQRVRLLLEFTPQMLDAARPKSPVASPPAR
jgi:hypothetical protein